MRFVKIAGRSGPNSVGPFTTTDPGDTIADHEEGCVDPLSDGWSRLLSGEQARNRPS